MPGRAAQETGELRHRGKGHRNPTKIIPQLVEPFRKHLGRPAPYHGADRAVLASRDPAAMRGLGPAPPNCVQSDSLVPLVLLHFSRACGPTQSTL